MHELDYDIIPQSVLQGRIDKELPDNEDRESGFALVNDYEDGMSKWEEAGGKIEQAA